jgi:hypothetical protein
MAKKLTVKKQALVNAMKKYFSNITSACDACHISRATFYSWYNKDSLFRENIDDLRMLLDDNIETTAISKCLNDRDTTMLIFMLKTRMKARGYVEKTEVEQVGELRIMQETSLDFSKLSIEELRVLKALSDKAKK